MTGEAAPLTLPPHEPLNQCDISEELEKLEANTLFMFQGFW